MFVSYAKMIISLFLRPLRDTYNEALDVVEMQPYIERSYSR